MRLSILGEKHDHSGELFPVEHYGDSILCLQDWEQPPTKLLVNNKIYAFIICKNAFVLKHDIDQRSRTSDREKNIMILELWRAGEVWNWIPLRIKKWLVVNTY